MRFARIRQQLSQYAYDLIRISKAKSSSNFCFGAKIKVFVIEPGRFSHSAIQPLNGRRDRPQEPDWGPEGL